MKTLTDYKKNGYHWRIKLREGDVALASADEREAYEVFIVQSHNGREIAGNWCEPAEFSPSNEQWGRKGWSYANRGDAASKFDELVNASLAARVANNAGTKETYENTTT